MAADNAVPLNDCPNARAYRTLVAACGVAMSALVPVALFQSGAVRTLPDPSEKYFGQFFASEQITSSKDAHPFGVPDSLLGLVSYGTTLALACSAPRSRFARKALAGKLLLDGSMAAMNTWKQFAKFRRACSWCMVTAASTAVMMAAGRRYLNSTNHPEYPRERTIGQWPQRNLATGQHGTFPQNPTTVRARQRTALHT